MELHMRKRGWILLLVLLCVAFLMSCGKDTEPDEAKGELVRIEREGCQEGVLLFCAVGEPKSILSALIKQTNVFVQNTQKWAIIPLKNNARLKNYIVTVLKFKMLLE